MDGFTYNNIFDTKGIEYLVVIGFFLILIPFWILLNKEVRVKDRITRAFGLLTAGVLKIPQGIFYSANHTWTHLEKSGIARLGLDDLLLHITGTVNFKNLRRPGEKITKGDIIGEIEQNGKQLRVLSPVSGEILNVNSIITDHPELVSEDPYQKGWMYKIKPEKWISETSSYYLAEDASRWLEQELSRFKDFLARSAGRLSPETSKLILQDGGELSDNTLSGLPEEVWHDFEKDFLSRMDRG
jgi:glycine cleavage system H protein